MSGRIETENKLREKIEREPRTPKHVITVWGIGYKFEVRP